MGSNFTKILGPSTRKTKGKRNFQLLLILDIADPKKSEKKEKRFLFWQNFQKEAALV